MRELDRTTFRNKTIRIKATESKQSEITFDLPLHKAIELANYYLGFNGWRSGVVRITKKELPKENDNTLFFCCHEATARVTLPDGRSTEGDGEGVCDGNSRGEAINLSKKVALSMALKNALKKYG